jgi:hypothetical protein
MQGYSSLYCLSTSKQGGNFCIDKGRDGKREQAAGALCEPENVLRFHTVQPMTETYTAATVIMVAL